MALYKVFIKAKDEVRNFATYNDDYFKEMLTLKKHSQYDSIFIYEDKHIEYYKTHFNKKGNNTLSGITDVNTDKLVFDFDSEDSPQKALDDARELVARLQQFITAKTAIRCYFSGSKGYHIEVYFKENQFISQKQFESLIKYYASDLETFDPKVKDHQRVFRFPLSRHEKTGKFKIPIAIDYFTDTTYNHEFISGVASDVAFNKELLDEAILTQASYGRIEFPEQFQFALEDLSKNEETTLNKELASLEAPDMSKYNKELTPAKYALSTGFFEEGERNEACMILAATYKFKNYTDRQAYEMIKLAVNYRNERLGLHKVDEEGKRELWETIIGTVYSPTWNGATYSDSTNALLQTTIARYSLEKYYNPTASAEVMQISEVGDLFLKFANEIDNNLIKTGISELDENVLLTSSMMVGILGAPSSGKTAFTLNTLEHQSKNGISSFFMSSDMAPQLLYASLLRRYCKKSFKEILDIVKKVSKSKWPKEMQDAWDIVQENFKNVGLCFKSGPTVEDIRQQVDAFEQQSGNPVRFFAMDYLEKMLSKYSDPTASTGYNAARVADFTRDKNVTTFLLLQTQKAAGDPSDELLSMRNIKGASVIEQDCRVVLTTWRPGFNPDVKGFNPDDKFASFAVVKNNMGTTGRFDFHVDPKSGLYRSLNDEELPEFDEVKRKAAERKLTKLRTKAGLVTPASQNGGNYNNNARQPVKFVAKSTSGVETSEVFTKKPTKEPEQKLF